MARNTAAGVIESFKICERGFGSRNKFGMLMERKKGSEMVPKMSDIIRGFAVLGPVEAYFLQLTKIVADFGPRFFF